MIRLTTNINVIDISIIMPVKNGGQKFNKGLSSIFAQKSLYSYEVIVIDSGSIDGSLDVVKQYPVRLYQIPPGEFSHSKTRNLGASYSKASSYLIYLNQDALPSDENWLNDMVKSIEFEPDLKAACATELIEGCDYFNVTGVASYIFRNSAVKGIYVIEPYILSKCNNVPKERYRELFPFTTVCAIFEKKHFEKYRFDENVPWGEDLYWAVSNSNSGFKSACSAFAKVYHSHIYSEKECEEIEYYTNKLLKDLFNIDPQPKQRLSRFNKILNHFK